MSQNQTFYTAADTDDETEIDARDLFASLLLRWKSILACLLICGLLGCGAAFLRASRASSQAQLALLSARAALTEEQAVNVEVLKKSSLAYEDSLPRLQDEYAAYLMNASKSDAVLLYANYYLSSSLKNLSSVLPRLSLSDEDYDALRAVCAENKSQLSIYDRVTITCPGSGDTLENGAFSADEVVISEAGDSDCFLLITVCGFSREECEAMLKIAEAAVKAHVEAMRAIDPGIEFSFLEKVFSLDARSFFDQRITRSAALIDQVQETQKIAETRIKAFSAEERAYYELLADSDAASAGVSKTVSSKKYALIGAFLGLFLSLGIGCLNYLLDARIKTPDECKAFFSAQVLQRISLAGKKNLFGKWAMALTGAKLSPPEEKIGMLATNILLLAEKPGYKMLMLLCDPDDENACHIAEAVRARLAELPDHPALNMSDPTTSESGLAQLANSDAAVVFFELRHSRRDAMAEWRDLCLRYQVPVIGTASVEVCW